MTTRSIETGTDELLCEVTDHVATITMNRPEKRNALGDQMTPALREILLATETDPDVRVVVLTGSGEAFCAGGDVSGMGDNLGGGNTAGRSIDDMVRGLQHAQESVSLRLFDFAKPTIAALPGAAAGAGMSIALACDLRIAADSAVLVPAFGRIGLSGDFGGSWLLSRHIGPGRAKEVYFTGRRIDATEAQALYEDRSPPPPPTTVANSTAPDAAPDASARAHATNSTGSVGSSQRSPMPMGRPPSPSRCRPRSAPTGR